MSDSKFVVEDIVSQAKTKTESKYRNPSKLAPQHPFRMTIVGESGSGKSNLVANMILKNMLSFDKVIIVAHNPDQEIYDLLKEKFEAIAEEKEKPLHDFLKIISNIKDFPVVEKFSGKYQILIVWDDWVMETPAHRLIADFYVRSRHKNISNIYLAQTFYDVPKVIRGNSNYFILFKGLNKRSLDMLYRDLGFGIDKDLFIDIYEEATRERYSWLLIDKVTEKRAMRFRQGFNKLLGV